MTGRRDDAVAIVGLACRLPQAPDPEALWRLLRDEVDAIGAFPSDRLGAWDGDPAQLPPAGFLERVDGFDAELFGVSPREAVATDPQQRLALELAWEGLEDAGLDAGRLSGEPVGVFLGLINGDYADVMAEVGDTAGGRHALTGLGRSITANRISHTFGFEGPSLVVDTGQSSGLVSVHLACESLLGGESALALAGGVNLILSPLSSVRAAQFGAMSPDGRAYVFDARANGFVRGEGGGVVVLKPLSAALCDGDRVYAVIHGTAVRSGTGASGMTAPSEAAQARVIGDALVRAGVDPAGVGYVELHGTGTQAGDPVEAAALGAVYGPGRPAGRPLAVGSIKTNVGHLEGAAGTAGLLKAALCVDRRELVRSLNFSEANPRIALGELGLRVVTSHEPWPDDLPALAGVSSFGVGGTNCHVVLGAAPEGAGRRSRRGANGGEVGAESGDPAQPKAIPSRQGAITAEEQRVSHRGRSEGGSGRPPAVAWIVSGHSEPALRAQAQRLRDHVEADPELEPVDVAWSLATGRARLAYRAVVAGADRAALLDGLGAVVSGEPADRVARGVVASGSSDSPQPSGPDRESGLPGHGGKVAFVFPGQGSQWAGMGIELWDTSPVVAAAMDACAEALAPYCDWSLRDVLAGAPGAPSLERLDVVQPALFAVSVALAALWRSYGVQPDVVVGHSQGEIPAAYVAGVLSLPDAARAAALRSRALATLQGTGAMMSILDDADAVQARLERWSGRISLGAYNGPGAVTVSGDIDALDELLAACDADGIRARRVPAADVASHSAHMETLRERLLEDLAPLAPRSGDVAFRSAVTGEPVDGARLGADYWFRNVREPVRFEQATRGLVQDGVTTFIEISAHPVLTIAVANTIAATATQPAAAALATLRRGEGGLDRFLTSAGEVGVRGVDVDWRAAFAGSAPRRVDLPTYAFQRRRFWVGEEPEEEAPVASGLGAELAQLATADRVATLLEVVRAESAHLLGHESADAVAEGRAFKELGFDSLDAVQLSGRLAALTGLDLPPMLAFDHPTPAAVAAFIAAELGEAQPAERGRAEPEPERSAAAAGLPEPVARAERPPSTRGSGRPGSRSRAPTDDPIAIVGMSCRYPGGVCTPQELWRLVAAGTDAVGGFPADRGWDLDGIYDPDPDHPGTTYTRRGGFLYDAGDFDAAFFGIGPREAMAMDPQQRLLLETAWEAVEDAGIDPATLNGSETGVFAGISTQDYGSFQAGEAPELEGLRLTGALTSVVSGRVAYALGLQGPAVTIDTACSSSLVALHLACQALRAGDCSLALAGGATVLATPGVFVEFARQRGLAADGRCKSFAASADGTGWAEGAGLVLVERLSDARRNGHRVLALVRGTATNQDGASNGLTAPNGPSQERVIRRALADAGLSAADVDAVEAHGTGTTLGDPIEAQALLATYGRERSDGPLRLGSIKSNFGHAQAAAGVAGVIKMVMALREGALPPTLHVDAPSPHVAWGADQIELLTRTVPWPRAERVRRCGVSSFGISGTNAHVVLEEAPREAPAPDAPVGPESAAGPQAPALAEPLAGEPQVVPWILSAKSHAGLREQAGRLGAHLEQRPELDPVDVGWSLATGRARLEHRAAVVASGRDALLAGLDAVATGRPSDGVVAGVARSSGRVAFVFPGQGSQWPGMGVELWDSSPAFAEHMNACAEALAPFVDWSLEDVLRGTAGAPALERVDVVQPALFAVMVSLAGLWRSHGVEPAVVAGHSQGEIAAAHVAGALSLSDAARVTALRSRALAQLAGAGGMLSVSVAAAEAEQRIEAWGARLALATYNGPRSVVVSGDPEALDELEAACVADDVRARRIPVDYASHSAQVEAIRDRLLTDLAPIAPRAVTIPMVSTTTGAAVQGGELDAAHWYRNLREPVRFEQVVRALLHEGTTAFVEASAHPVLTWAVQETVDEAGGADGAVAVVGSLRRDDGGRGRFTTSVAEAHVHGARVDWEHAFAVLQPRRVDLPTYAFQRRRFWLERRSGGLGDLGAAGVDAAGHPLLGAAVALAGQDGWLLTGRVSTRTHAWLADHAVLDTVLLPGTALVELALRAGAQAGCDTLEELTLQTPLVLRGEAAAQLQVTVGEADASGRRPVTVHARGEEDDAEWVRHATGTVGAGADADAATAAREPQETWPPPGAEPLDVDELDDRLAGLGFAYGPAFQGVRAAWRYGDELLAEVALPAAQAEEAGRFGVHPALLDAALHPAFARPGEAQVRLPFSWSGVRVHQAGAAALRVCMQPAGAGTPTGADGALQPTGEEGAGGPAAGPLRLTATDERGEPVLSIAALASRPLAPGTLAAAPGPDALFELTWEEAPAAADEPAAVFTDAVPDARDALRIVQDRLADQDADDARLVLVTRGAVAAREGEPTSDPRSAAVWGLVRSAQAEHPGRFALLDVDSAGAAGLPLPASDEPQAALRDGTLLVPRLVRAGGAELPGADWRLGVRRAGSLDGVGPVTGDGGRPLGEGEVRIAVRAAGINFRDVLIALGTYPGQAPLGSEAAGVVVEVGPGAAGVAVGDRVMGLVPESFGPLAVADARLLVHMPARWSFARAASVPVAFATAYHALVDLADVQAGERVLIHNAMGGVGLAAVQIAQARGVEVFATASPAKLAFLRELGIDEDHRASSRTADFRERFLATTGGDGVDVVLDALAGELVDASLDLLSRGGRFVEMGKADVRDVEQVARERPGVRYRAFDLFDAGPRRLGEILTEVTGSLERGELRGLPLVARDVRDGVAALRFVSQARHVGKVVLTVPRALDPDGTVLVTGGTGELGAIVARHLAERHGARHLLLASRQGPEADGAGELRRELEALGCRVAVAACDVGDRAAVAELLAGVPDDRPLTAVMHAAGALADGVIDSMDGAAVDRVMFPKAYAARWLDELTAGEDLAMFVLFSSVAGTFGTQGQANYAAANAYLDALAQRRRSDGLPATSVAWGLWAQASGLTGGLRSEDVERLGRIGLKPVATEQGLALLDAALAHPAAALVAVPLDPGTLRAQAAARTLPALLRGLVRAPAPRAAEATTPLAGRLASAAPEERRELLLELVREQAAATLGHPTTDEVLPARTFKELGFDSLGAVELRNRLAQATGLRLPATLVFEQPTPTAMAEHLEAQAAASVPVQAPVTGMNVEPPAATASTPGPRAAGAPAAPLADPQGAITAEEQLVSHHAGAGAPVSASAPALRAHALPAPASELVGSAPSGAPSNGYRGSVLGAAADLVRTARFRAWVLTTRLRLARLGCRLVVEAADTPRFEGPPRIAVDAMGGGRGSLTLRIGRDCRFGRDITLDLWTHADGVIEIGDRAVFQSRIRLQAWDGAIRLGHGIQVRDGSELKSKGELVAGADVVIARNVTVHCHERIELGDRVGLAEGVTVMDSDHTHDGTDTNFLSQPVVSTPVRLEDNVMVATNAMIMRGSHVGRNAFVATGAVLTGGEYPARHLLAGVPAQAVRPLDG